MIFVTVGTHEQPFNRLVEYIDKLVEKGAIEEEVIIQSGYSTYEPKHCQFSKMLPYQQMVKNVQEARIVITHGGPASFIMPLQYGKIPIVVPRQKKFNEHVNDHQLEFSSEVAKRQKNIIVVDDIENLEKVICDYEKICADLNDGVTSNNEKFNEEFKKIVDSLF